MIDKSVGAEIEFTGIVQGVGFRPSVYRIAVKHGLKGEVRNTEKGVLLRLDGHKKQIANFLNDFFSNLPVLAEIHKTKINYKHPFGFKDFRIEESLEGKNRFTPISPDIATCSDCLRELFDPSDRRYRYPFINCTNCGPRFTIIESVPYDRKNTTMKVFEMCPECAGEYNNPLDRRYHAQPNACPDCGPELIIVDEVGNIEGKEKSKDKVIGIKDDVGDSGENWLENRFNQKNVIKQKNSLNQKNAKEGRHVYLEWDPIKIAAEKIRNGKIVAVKGLGGFHLAVDPFNENAVVELRKRKKRPGKPFALMARDIEVVMKYCILEEHGEKLLLSYQRPIVLLKRKTHGLISKAVAPDTDYLGVMLPYTPIHYLLMNEGFELLVMTSANLSEEPLAYLDSDAEVRLKGIADLYLTHNREIARPCDDSVVCVLGWNKSSIVFPLRRSRGYVPRAIIIEDSTQKNAFPQILAFGSQEKNTFCLLKDGKAFLSHHIGDLDNPKSVEAYERGIEDFGSIFNVDPEILVCDMHPDYTSTRIAESFSLKKNLPLIKVQHHHAHLASLLAEKRAGKIEEISYMGMDNDENINSTFSKFSENELLHLIKDQQALIKKDDSKAYSKEKVSIKLRNIEGRVEDKDKKIIGIIFDGTGFGLDGAIWGGEFLLGDAIAFERVGHIRYVPMLGGEMCIKDLSRMALSWLFTVYRDPERLPGLLFLNKLEPKRMKAYKLMYEGKLPAPLTSSCGRLFDAVSAILGICFEPTYDAQGAILLETYAERYFDDNFKEKNGKKRFFPGIHYPYRISDDWFCDCSERRKWPERPEKKDKKEGEPKDNHVTLKPIRQNPFEYPIDISQKNKNNHLVLDFSPTIEKIVEDFLSGKDQGYIAYCFHKTVAHSSIKMCEKIRSKTGCSTVGLSGGVFQNKLLLKMMLEELSIADFDVITHRLVPPNDGGLSLGQAYIALSRYANGLIT